MLGDMRKILWSTADELRANMDAADYRHFLHDLISLKFRTFLLTTGKEMQTKRVRLKANAKLVKLSPSFVSRCCSA